MSVEVSFSSAFKRAFKKRIKGNTDLEEKFWQKLELFTLNPYEPSLKTHKLSGKLKELWSFSVDYDERVLFYFQQAGRTLNSTTLNTKLPELNLQNLSF